MGPWAQGVNPTSSGPWCLASSEPREPIRGPQLARVARLRPLSLCFPSWAAPLCPDPDRSGPHGSHGLVAQESRLDAQGQ